MGGGGEGGRRDKVVVMFTHGGQAADNITRGGGTVANKLSNHLTK